MSRDLRLELATGPLTPFQIAAIAICVGLNMLDGFDILAMSFSASGVKADWQLHDGQIGALLSGGLVGMAVGSLTLGPCADRWGRRRIVLLAAAIAGAGMLLSCAARNFTDLLVLRVITGVGIGGTIASVAVIVSEYAPDRWRRTALAIYATGYSIGATLGGAITTIAVSRYGWRAAFLTGGIMSLLMLPLAWWHLPESLDFLVSRRPPKALERVNALLRLTGRPQVNELDAPCSPLALSAVERPRLLNATTLLAWVVFFSTMAGFYFIVSWTPRLLTAAGLSSTQGMTGGVLLNLGGIAGCGLYALAAMRLDAHRLLAAALLLTALMIAAFSLALGSLSIALGAGLILGVAANAAMAGLYAVGPPLYATAVRATGMGLAIGVGRFGAIIAPVASGLLLDRGWSGADLYRLFSVPFLIAAVATFALGPARSR
ncbi:MAG: MFS transporter [Proteobacteria bacterium]|nr:MFS transporter [Pseudomonadota bacterium]